MYVIQESEQYSSYKILGTIIMFDEYCKFILAVVLYFVFFILFSRVKMIFYTYSVVIVGYDT